MKNRLLILFVLQIVCTFFVNGESAALDMSVYCYGEGNKISTIFPSNANITENIIENGQVKQYIYQDISNFMHYNLHIEKLYTKLDRHKFLESRIDSNIKQFNAKLLSKTYKNRNDYLEVTYLYSYAIDRFTKLSARKSIISDNIFVSWNITSIEGISPYTASQIMKNYSKYYSINGQYCRN